ncbi:MAG: carotenoid oxygenase family protein [Deltaproteobacteria bacterium]|nr:carotenoid oxygenase family protein [Deltaproteobacteria bacterium]
MANEFAIGFDNLEQETIDQELHVDSGHLPPWLRGSLIRTGPTLFRLAQQSYQHWFDGLAMLQKFAFDDGKARYTGRFLRSPDYVKSSRTGLVSSDEFVSVPSRGPLERLFTLVDPERQFGRNGMVNVLKLNDSCYIAMTENPLAVQFNPADAATVGAFDYPDDLHSVLNMITTAHPRYDVARKSIYNFVSRLIPLRPRYVVYRLDNGSTRRTVVGEIETDALAYMHSFGMSENYIVLAEFPLVTHPTSLFFMPLFGTPYIKSYTWKAQRGTRFRVMDKRDGKLVGTWEHDALFAFHHVHAQEVGDELFVDLSVYEGGPAVIDQFYLARLRAAGGGEISYSGLRRYRLPLRGGSLRGGSLRGDSVREERLAEPMLEMPQFNYRRCSNGSYRYIYGVSFTAPGKFVDQLVKIDLQKNENRFWHEDGCYPGEPVFVPRTAGTAAGDAGAEDDGVNISVVLDTRRRRSFLLLLDASTFEEMARLDLPHAIPFMLHGQFYAGVL